MRPSGSLALPNGCADEHRLRAQFLLEHAQEISGVMIAGRVSSQVNHDDPAVMQAASDEWVVGLEAIGGAC